jgi:DNA-binding transcriptional ArsR family regulator
MTKKEMFTAIANLVDENNLEILDELGNTVVSSSGIVGFLKNEINLLDKRNSYKSKSNKKAKENEPIKDAIVEVLTNSDKGLTVSEITKSPEVQAFSTEDKAISGNKVTALLVQLRKAGVVKREYVKKVAYFSLGQEEVEEETEETED